MLLEASASRCVLLPVSGMKRALVRKGAGGVVHDGLGVCHVTGGVE